MIDATRIETQDNPTPSPGPYGWAVIPSGEEQMGWIHKHFSFGSGDIHAVWLPNHEGSVIGDDPERPERAVILCVTGNGPKSKDNARFLVAVLNARETLSKNKPNLPIPTTPDCVAWSEYAIQLEAAMGIEEKIPDHMRSPDALLKRLESDRLALAAFDAANGGRGG